MGADRHIAIAGGGVAGLTAALAIAGPETQVTVFEPGSHTHLTLPTTLHP